MLRMAALLLALLSTACVSYSDTRVFLTSEPPGADVAVDGKETGLTTPAILDFEDRDDHVITVSKAGHDPETRQVFHKRIIYTSRWFDGAADPAVISLFLFWTFGDMVAFFGVRQNYEPHELHVKLYERGEFVLRRPEEPATRPQSAPEKQTPVRDR